MIKGILFYIALTILLLSPDIFGDDLNTGNILTNSTFGTGETVDTTGWSTGGDHGIHTHGEWGFPYQTGMDDSGGVLAFEGHQEDNVYQDVDLVGDGHLTQSQINQGFTSTMAADVWFWNSIENKLTLKQTITASDGSVSTQVREINDYDPNRSTNGGQFTNYTNVYTHSSNTQTDFTIRAELYNETVGTTYDGSHYGPDVDNVTLNVTYRNLPPISEDTQEELNDINEDIIDVVDDIPDDFDWSADDLYFEEEYVIVEDNFTFEEIYFEDIDTIYIDELPPVEEFDMEGFEEIPEIEEVFFENDFTMEPPPAMMEEVFTEEFEEDFTDFLEETGMEEEFMEFLEEEGITAEEFFEEIAEEEFNDELTEESFEEFEEPMEEVATNEESVPEVAEDEKEAVEKPAESDSVEEEKEVANNETTEEKESDSPGTEDSEVQSEEGGEQEDIQSEDGEEVDSKDRIATDVAKVETNLKKNLKKIAKQIAKVTKETTQTLSKEDLFFKDNSLDAYKEIVFYSAKDIYENTNMGLFLQIDLSSYSGEIYAGASLSSYTDNDPVEVHRVKLLNIETTKRKLQAELEALKQ